MYSSATITDMQLLRHWCDLAAKKREDAQKQLLITAFLKNAL
jgi:hypothetical protein